MKLSKKIGLWFFTATVIPMSILIFVFYTTVKSNLKEGIYEHLTTTAESKARWINSYLAERKAGTFILALSDDVKTAFEKLKACHKGCGATSTCPYKSNAKTYKKTYSEIDPFFRRYAAVYGYYDLFLVCAKHGCVMYTAAKEADLGADLKTGPLKDSGLGKLWAKVLRDKKISFADFEYYAPSDGPAMFVGAPVLDKHAKIYGVIVLQVSSERINEIMQDRTGLGETGETYLVGEDYLMRSDSRFFEESTILKQKAETENVRDCFTHEATGFEHRRYEDVKVSRDYRGVSVLGTHIFIPEMKWALLAEIDAEEAFGPLTKVRLFFITAFCSVLCIVYIISILISKRITTPVRKLQQGAEIIGRGNLDYKVGTDAKGEIGQLSRAFDQMTEDLKKTTTSRDELDAANQQLQASEQHLKATNQQLQAREQHLRAANQQLQAKEQQLRASNQQLRANEQHLKVTNEQLQVSEEKLKAANQQLRAREQHLKATNQQLQANEHQLRTLNHNLAKRAKELKEMQSQMVQNEKLAAIGQLAAGVAHEMNTPVGFVASNFQTLGSYMEKFQGLLAMYGEIVGGIETLEKTELLEKVDAIGQSRKAMEIDFVLEDIGRLFDDSREGLDRVTDIVQNLRDFSRIDQPGSLDEYNINKGIKTTLVVANNEIKYDADVKTELSKVPNIPCHSGRINQVFLNILLNAAQAIRSQERDEKGTITIRTYVEDEYAVCEIIDDGPGVASDKLSKIFDPFFTTKTVGKGTGLGLSVSYDIIVVKHGGKLLVDSAVGEGTKFTIKLPIERKDASEEKESGDGCIVCERSGEECIPPQKVGTSSANQKRKSGRKRSNDKRSGRD